jgi:tetratricopeptide (TPR) repeat protein
MIHFRHTNKKKLIIILIFSTLLFLAGCDKDEDSEKHLQKGAEYINKGEYDKAKLEIKSASQSGKETAETYYYMALLNEKRQQFREMKENLLKTVELAPTFTDARLKLGKVQLLFGETDAAMGQAEFVLKDSGQNLEAQALKASVLIRQKKKPEALAIIDNILGENPNHTDALSLKALIYMDNKDYKQALALIDAAKKTDANNLGLDFFQIQLHAKEQNIDAIMADYEKLVASHPENKEFKVTLAKIYSQAGKTKEAEVLLRDLIESEPNNVQPKLLLLEFLSATAAEKVNAQFQQFMEKHKDQPRMLLELANWMIARRNFEEAKKALNRVIELEDNSNVGLSAKTLLAKLAFENKDFEGSEKIVEEILDANSSYDEAKVLKARLLLVKGQYDEAIALLNRVIWSSEDSEEANLLLGQTFLIKGDQKLADKHFLSALEANPANLQALTYLYDKALTAKNVKYAKEMVEKALKVRPDNIVLLEKLANINLAEHDWDGAKATAQKIANSPNPLAKDVASYLLAQVHQGQGDYEKAVEIYKELLTKFPDNSDALGNMASCYEKLNKRGEMITFLDRLLAKNPQNISASILLGDLYLMDKKFDKGTALLTNMIKDNEKIPQLYVLLANTKLAMNDNKGAIVVYQEGLKRNPENIKLSLSLASLYEELGAYDSAVSLYEDLINKNPNLDIAINRLAVLLSDHYTSEEKLRKAVHLAEKFKDSAQPYYKDTYAWALIKLGNINEGSKLLNEIIIASPDTPVFRYHLGFAQYKNGNNSLAINEIKQALELGKKIGSFSEKKEAEKVLEEIIAKTRGH